MAFTLARLGKSRPTDTNVATLYTVPASTTLEIGSITICNTTATAATCRVFIGASGETADETTAILYDYSIPPNSVIEGVGKGQVLAASGTIKVRTGTANALNFTASGGLVT